MSSLSAATTHDPESPSTPTYPNGEPILYTGNPAELTGILEALNEHFVNNGLFQPLLTHGAVLLRNGKVAVDSFTTATFLTDPDYADGVGSFEDPYMSTTASIAKYNASPAGKAKALTAVTTKPADFDVQFIVSPEMCKAEDNRLLKTVLSIIPNETIAGRLRTAAKGSGRALLNLLRSEAAKAKPADTALVEATFNAHVLNKLHGAPITAENLAAFIEKYKQLEAMLPRAMRALQTDGTRLEIVNQLAQVDPNICDQYEVRMTALGSNAPKTMDDAVALIEEILRTRAARAKLAALSSGAKQLGLVAGNVTVSDRDPTKNKPGDEKKTKKPKPPRRPDGSKKGELLKWIEGMDLCKCGGKHLYRDCPDPSTKAWFEASKAKKDAEKAKAALTATPASTLASTGGGGGARATTVTITGDHTTDERALLAQLSGFLDTAEPSKVVHLSETAKTVHFAHVAKIKFIDGIAQLIDPSADELSLAETLGIATANLDPSNNQGPDFVPGCSGACALRQCAIGTTDSARSDDNPDPAPRCKDCTDNPDDLGDERANGPTAEKHADETADFAAQPADESPAEPADPSRDDAMRAAVAPLLIASRVAAILDARRRQRLTAGPPAVQWLAASAIGIILFALVAGSLVGPTSAPIHAIDGPFSDGDPGGDAVLRSDALSSVAHRISEGLIARASYHVLLTFVTTVFTVAVLWPAAFAAIAGRQPADVAQGLAYVVATPMIGLVNSACSLGPATGRSTAAVWLTRGTSSAASALTRLRRVAPIFVATALLASAIFIGPAASDYHSAVAVFRGTNVTRIELPYYGRWVPQGSAVDEALRLKDPAALEALVAGATSEHQVSPIGILKLHPDSGCTGSNTPHLHLLANRRPCDEIYSQANGNISRCEAIGDLPVIVRNKQGAAVQLTFTNVRCVPEFKFSLLSVKQLWNEQGIDARFCDINALVLPNQSGLIPYDPDRSLSTINAVPCAHVAASANRVPPPAPQTTLEALASLGFHQVGSISHLAKLSGVQIGALMHRRNHGSIHKIKACVHASKDGPKNLGTAVQPTCLDCAATRIKAAAHSGRREPCTEPGTLHIDLKEFARSYGGYQYALIAVDEHTRYIFTQCLRQKSEALDAVKRVVAEFNAIVGTRLDTDGKPLPRPTVRTIMSDREGKLISHAFNEFRADASLHHNTSAPHDHDLNGIAERAIGAVSETAAALLHSANATILEWPWLIRYAVDWHNSLIGDTGTSSADPQISPYQRLTHKLPAIMDLARYGCRAVVLKPPNQQNKTALDSRGWVGTFCGRSVNSPGCWDVNCNGTIVSSSSVQVDEEYMPRLGSQAHQPLPPTAPTTRTSPPDPVPHIDSDRPVAPAAPSAAPINASVHHERPARKTLSLLNLFSGPYHRTDGLAATLSAYGWTNITQIDNDAEVGGGWQHDVLNDATYTKLLAECSTGQYDALMIAFPCSTFSVSRFFDATVDGHDSGPPIVRDHDHPDGIPDLDPKHVKELKTSNLLLERTVELALAAHRSTSRATIILENPADRSIRGSTCFSEDLAKHGSLFATSAVARLIAGLENSSTATFAYCRLGSDFQKYTTLLYTNDAAPVLDDLNQHNYQCNHPRGSHNKVGGRGNDGSFKSKEAAPYPQKLILLLARALTLARTGSAEPLDQARPEPIATRPAVQSVAKPIAVSPRTASPLASSPARPPPSTTLGSQPTPLPFPNLDSALSPKGAAIGAAEFSGDDFVQPSGGALKGQPVVHAPPTPWIPPALRTTNDFKLAGAGSQAPVGPRRSASSKVNYFPKQPTHREYGPKWLPAVPEEKPSTAADLEPDQLTPIAERMEHAAAAIAFSANTISPESADCAFALSAWIDGVVVPPGAVSAGPGTYTVDHDALAASLLDAAAASSTSKAAYEPMLEALTALNLGSLGTTGVSDGTVLLTALRADSPDAPATHAQAAQDPRWLKAEAGELDNHKRNGSWEELSRSQVPRGRRVHKLVWVYKVKRDGTCKARLCVQGCTLEEGIDFDQTFSAALRYSSARGLFCYAARKGCKVRSIDYVAAYLQGKFIEGEVIYCHMPPGYVELDPDGIPRVLKIVKPIYGIPQAGRRLQRQIFPWMKAQGLKPLDDSDPCVFVREDDSDGEIFVVGLYVDNLQIVHSVDIDDKGNAPPGSFCASFLKALNETWDVIDEGPMVDLLGIQVRHNADGSITLHQEAYIDKLVERFLPGGVPPSLQGTSLPYSRNLDKHVSDAAACTGVDYPHLVKPFQERIGSLMYATTSTRCDIAYPVHQLCKCLAKPTPELMEEADRVIAYLARHRSVGITFDPGPTDLHAFSDASWEVRNSTSGWVVMWGNAALSWGSRKQKCVALSSCEAELVALSEATKDVVYSRKFVTGLDKSAIRGPTDLRTDNTAARHVSYNPELHDRMKHVARRHFFVRDMVENFEINVPFVPTKENVADFFTKSLPAPAFFAFRKILMNERDQASPPSKLSPLLVGLAMVEGGASEGNA
jgi:hypothetical protein